MQVFKSKTFKRIVSLAVLLLMLIGTYTIITETLSDTTYRTYFEKDVKKIKDNNEDVDIVFVGASRMYMSIVPSVLEEKLGVSNVLVGSTATQPICGSYYYIKELIKDVHPKKVILDVTWDRLLNEKQAQALLLVYDRLSGVNKIDYAFNCFDKTNRCYLLGPCRYKDNILVADKVIAEKKLEKESWGEKENAKGETYKEKGFVYAVSDVTTGSISFDPEADYWYSDDRILEENKEYLDKCVELCKENGVEFELVTAPCSVTYMYFVGGYDDADKWYRNYAKEKGINYINLNYLKGREDFLPDELMYDNCHTNGEGAYVTSEKYADLLLKEEMGEDISSYFYENLDEFKKDVHRIVALEAELEYSETANDDGSVDATMHLLSLKNPDAKAFYQIELQADGSDETTVLSEFSEEETVSIKLPGYTGYKLIVRAKSQYEGDKEARMAYSY